MAPARITTLALALVLLLTAATVTADHGNGPLPLGGDCPANICTRYAGSTQITFFPGAPKAPVGYESISAICPGTTQVQNCPLTKSLSRLEDFVIPPPVSYLCCNATRQKFIVITGLEYPKSIAATRDNKIVFTGKNRYTFKSTTNSTRLVGCDGITLPRVNNAIIVHPPDNSFNVESAEFCYVPMGSMSGDPKVVGGDGIAFYFHGRKDHDFCIVSDTDLHINAHFIGKRPQGRLRDFTWVQALGFVFGSHTLTVAVKRVGHWDGAVDHLEFTYNGQALVLHPGEKWASPGKGEISINRKGSKSGVDVEIRQKMGVFLNAKPILREESERHGYEITDEDCFAHFDMQFRFYNLSTAVDGVLGQTYRPGFKNPEYHGQGIMPVMGGHERFRSSSLLATDCALSQYTGAAITPGAALPGSSAACGSTHLPNGIPGGLACRR